MLARRQPRVYTNRRECLSPGLPVYLQLTLPGLNSTTATQPQNPSYPFYPSVTTLLHQNSIPDSEASKIPASGPKGRLLKGDVLAYLGAIAADYPATQAAKLAELGHLDLSNIKVAAAPAETKPAPAEKKEEAQPAVAEEEKVEPPTTSVTTSISLAAVLSVQNKLKESLGTTIPLSTFLARATDLANYDLPRSKGEKRTADELFEEILGGPEVRTSRGEYIPDLNAVEASAAGSGSAKSVPEEDIIDLLAGKGKKAAAKVSQEGSPGAAANVFSLTVPVEEEGRARAFLERVKDLLQVEPGRLVL